MYWCVFTSKILERGKNTNPLWHELKSEALKKGHNSIEGKTYSNAKLNLLSNVFEAGSSDRNLMTEKIKTGWPNISDH